MTDSRQVLDRTVNREKMLSLLHPFEPSHLPLLFTSVLMGDFCPIVSCRPVRWTTEGKMSLCAAG